MKKSTLLEVIKKVVKREVRSAIKEELNKKQPSDKPEFNQMMEHANGLFNNKAAETKNFTENPILNEALNQTAIEKEWPTMGGRQLNQTDAGGGSPGLAAMMGMKSPDEMFGEKPSAQQMIPADRKHVEIKPDVEQALTRDYSSLMKAIDKKKGK